MQLYLSKGEDDFANPLDSQRTTARRKFQFEKFEDEDFEESVDEDK